ncbi:MAG: hypothetical protein IJ794_10080 [Lachnospiraceae bacterium]|nr:hypothetical protein [Lachnospiraceae bacterium]
MLKIDYQNPMTKVFQYEYALYMLTSDLFAQVSCRSMVVERLKLYYAELAKMSKKEERVSFERQYELENEVQSLIERDVIGKVTFPGIHMCHAELTVRTERDGSHTFAYSDGIYGFSLHLKMNERKRCVGIEVRNNSQTKEKGEGLTQGDAGNTGEKAAGVSAPLQGAAGHTGEKAAGVSAPLQGEAGSSGGKGDAAGRVA